MTAPASFVDRVRPLLADCSLGEQLFMAALLEGQAGNRYREWAAGAADPALAQALTACGQREDRIASLVRGAFAGILRRPDRFDALVGRIQAEVTDIFGGRSLDEQYQLQAAAERGGEQLWKELAADEADPKLRELLLQCSALEAESAAFLESLAH